MVSVVAGGLAFGGAAWAKFTGTDNGAANSKAAKVAVDVSEGVQSGNCGNLLPGETCTTTFTVTNTGTVSEVFAATLTGGESGCYDNTVDLPAGKVEVGDLHQDYDPAEVGTATVRSTLKSSAGNECQEKANDVGLRVDGEASSSPRD